jgi:hypothetical protein
MKAARERRVKMPNKKEIINFWLNEYNIEFDDYFCWGCGFGGGGLQRAHLHASYRSNDNSPSNLVLLCKFCHDHIQEITSTNIKAIEQVKNMIIEGMPFFKLRYNFIEQKIIIGIYDNLIDEINVNKKDFEMVKDYLLSRQ